MEEREQRMDRWIAIGVLFVMFFIGFTCGRASASEDTELRKMVCKDIMPYIWQKFDETDYEKVCK